MTHTLDLAAVTAVGTEGGLTTLRLAHPLVIRAADGQRPVIRLARPLAFRADDVSGVDAGVQQTLGVHLQGLYLARADGFAGPALIARAAVATLTLDGCTLDPGGHRLPDGTRAPLATAMRLTDDHGFDDPQEEIDFTPTPRIVVRRSIVGALEIDRDYYLALEDSIVDAGGGLIGGTTPLAVGAATGSPATAWGPALEVERMTCFGRMRVASATGRGGLWVQRLEVLDTLVGCIKYSYFSGDHDRLPQNHACVRGPRARLGFVGEAHGSPGYAQLARTSDRHLLEEGPESDEMGAFGYLLDAHKWKNLSIRLREFMPVGVRPVIVPLT
jgi:hypothetical protein